MTTSRPTNIEKAAIINPNKLASLKGIVLKAISPCVARAASLR